MGRKVSGPTMLGSGTAAQTRESTFEPILRKEDGFIFVRQPGHRKIAEAELRYAFGIQSTEILGEEGTMRRRRSRKISVLEFRHQAPLRFFEHCAKCARFGNHCPDLALGKEVLRGKKKIAYGDEAAEDSIHMSAFSCQAPLYYIERCRMKCPRGGRCREEGLLLALLDGKKVLDYSYKKIIKLPRTRCRRKEAREAA